uniref:Phosphoinositide-3-kinase, regulatory subunit 6a n=1 Tax=Fundulus heteroclitus TaxID=8078 RepID=A0A3Q2NU86_FUNHE
MIPQVEVRTLCRPLKFFRTKNSHQSCWKKEGPSPNWDDVVSMADSTVTADDIEGELFKIERIRDILVRRESELRYMMDDIQLCKEITRLKKELHKLVSIPDKDKSAEDRQKEDELLQQIHKLVETRDFLVDDVEFERLRSAVASRAPSCRQEPKSKTHRPS